MTCMWTIKCRAGRGNATTPSSWLKHSKASIPHFVEFIPGNTPETEGAKSECCTNNQFRYRNTLLGQTEQNDLGWMHVASLSRYRRKVRHTPLLLVSL